MISFYKQHSEHHPRQKPLPLNQLRIAILRRRRRHRAVQLIHSRTTAWFVPQPERIITLIGHKEEEEENRVNEIDFIIILNTCKRENNSNNFQTALYLLLCSVSGKQLSPTTTAVKIVRNIFPPKPQSLIKRWIATTRLTWHHFSHPLSYYTSMGSTRRTRVDSTFSLCTVTSGFYFTIFLSRVQAHKFRV